MYRDNSLVPIEAMRVAALGAVAECPRSYAALAAEVRRFASRIVGPSLDLMGASVEALRAEGLIEALPGEAGADARLGITASGMEALGRLLGAGLRATSTELNRLVVALKLRYLHLLPAEARREQVDRLRALILDERQRYRELAGEEPTDGFFADWLGFELDLLDRRLDWLEHFAGRVGS